jgi:serine/threonine protein kinase
VTRQLRPESPIYQIEEAIGQGLSATVYKATRMDARGFSRQTVALKVLKSENAVPWLRREFETLTRLRSANCVRVLGWENLSEGCALVLEWIDGVNLLELWKSRALTQSARLSILEQIQAGLSDLQAQGLHHGDLSPANILVDREGTAKLIDFATPADEAGNVQGTIEYLAPEIWAGGQKGVAADLFALGLMAHDLETGFSDHPLDHKAARERAERMAQESPGWLSRYPSKRGFECLDASASSRADLARCVRECLSARTVIQTSILCERTPATDKPLPVFSRLRNSQWIMQMARCASVSAAMVALIIISAASRAHAPEPRDDQRRGQLEVRSSVWLEASLNGRPIGFAPFIIKNLRPGSHRISWRTATQAGEARLVIEPGKTALIRDRDLMSPR